MNIVFAFTAGVFAWSLLEYVIHRWLGHDSRTMPNPFGIEHTRHHAEGDYFAPTWKKVTVALALAALLALPLTPWLGLPVAGAFIGGLLLHYTFYEVLHRLEHVSPGRTAYGRWARKHHFYHHFTDAKFNHGVTTPVWDLVFRTYRTAQKIRVPKTLCMQWLLEPTTGQVRPELRAWYEIRGAKARPHAPSPN